MSRFVWPALAGLGALIPFAGGFSTRNVFCLRDLAMFFWPRHLWQWHSWHRGDWPFWDPYIGGGQSAVADALNQFFFVPVTLIRLLAPPVVGFNFWVAAPFPVLAVGTWAWLHRHVSAPAAFVGASVAAFAGPVMSIGNTPNLSWTAACVPWILWSVDRVCNRPEVPRIAALAMCVGLTALAGEPVTFVASSALAIAYAAVAIPAACWGEWRRRMLRVAYAFAAGLLLAAVQIAPLAFAVSRSQRAVDIDEMHWSLHPLMLIETLIPHLFGHAFYGSLDSFPWVSLLNSGREPLFYSLYVGVGACALATVAALGPTSRRWRLFWWSVCGLALLSALGKYTPFYPALERVVPVLQSFRFPVKYLVVAVFALAALAASGADGLLTWSRAPAPMPRPNGAWRFLGIAAALAGVAGIAGVLGADWIGAIWIIVGGAAGLDDLAGGADWLMQAGAPLLLRLAALSIGLVVLLAIVRRRHYSARLAAWTICAVAAVDPLAVNYDLQPTLPASHIGAPEWAATMLAQPEDRVYVGGRLRKGTAGDERLDATRRYPVPLHWSLLEAISRVTAQFVHTPAAWGIRELISYDLPQLWPHEYTIMLKKFRDAPRDARLRFLQRTGTRYCFVSEPPSPGAAPIVAPSITAPVALYECGSDPRRVYVTGGAIVEPDVRRQIDLMLDADHDPFAAVLVDRDSPPAGNRRPGASSPAARIVRERNMDLLVTAAVGASGGYLTLLDSYDPFWRVDVDGEPAALLRANGLFRAVRLAPGQHEVRFRYRPRPLYIGFVLTSATGMVLIVASWAALRRRRRGEAPPGVPRQGESSLQAG